jgi:iron complex outermembrane recepter protein
MWKANLGAHVLCAVLLGLTLGSGAVPAIGAEPAQRMVIEEVLVTSRRIQESLQDVPVAVTAFTQEAIEQIAPRTLRDFDGLMPNVRIGMNTAGPSAGALYVRGIGYADIEKTQSPAVGVIIDGVYQGTSTGQLIDTFDVAQMEINRGPQGVLQGKNTTGGSIVVTRVRPEFNELGWTVSAQGGTYDERQFKARLNIPLVDDVLALKIAGITKERDGFYDNRTRGCNECAGAIDYDAFTTALRFEPVEGFSATLTYDYIKDRGDIPPQDPRWDGKDPFQNAANYAEFQKYDVDGLTLNVEWDLGFGVISSITGWQQADDSVGQDFDGDTRFTPAVPLVQLHTLREQEYEQFSQELKLTFNVTDNVRATVGGYYWDTELDFAQGTNLVLQFPPEVFDSIFGLPPGGVGTDCLLFDVIPVPGFVANPNPAIGDSLCQLGPLWADQQSFEKVESWALFAAVDWQVTDSIELSAGVRYLDEKKRFGTRFGERVAPAVSPLDELGDPINPPTNPGDSPQCINVGGVNVNPPCTFAGFPIGGKDSWDDVVFKLSGSWRISESNLVYASYSEGFRSGGFSIRGTDPARLTFEPEDVSSFEIGSKNDLFGRRLRLNLAAYYTELKDPQGSSILQQAEPPGTNTLILNGNKLVSMGLEVEAIWAVTDSFSLTAVVGLQDVENKRSTQSCLDVVFNPSGTPCNPFENPDLFPNPPTVTFPKQPGFLATDWNYAISAAYDRELGPGRFTAVAIAKVTDDVWISGAPPERIIQDGYALLDARVAYEWQLANNDLVRVALVGKNLTDTEYREQELPLGFGGFRGWGPPRQIAAEIVWSR